MIGNKVKGIGEVVLRVRDMQRMFSFYVNTLGLEPLRTDERYTFLRLAPGYRGHTQVLALFDAGNATAFGNVLGPVKQEGSPLHHLALEIDLENYNSVLNELKDKEVPFVTETFTWVKWRSIFIKDPENNIIEFVCYDPEI